MDTTLLTFNERDRAMLEAVAESWLTFWKVIADDADEHAELIEAQVDHLEKALWI